MPLSRGLSRSPRGASRRKVGTPPPASNTGVEITTRELRVGLHWLRGTTKRPLDTVLGEVVREVGESVVVLPKGMHGYREGYSVGPVRVYHDEGRPDMGVCVEFSGSACEELGPVRIGAVHVGLGLRASRVDFAVDGCSFTPADLRDQWRADNVRTLAKVPEKARPGREWRTSRWLENSEGDTFEMGSRTSTQYARCYDARGFTRLELELKKGAAARAAGEFFAAVAMRDQVLVRARVLAWVRRFVDFVDREEDSNVSRAPLLGFWAAFVEGVETARVQLSGEVVRSVERTHSWLERQVASALAVVADSMGPDALRDLVERGRDRYRAGHRAMVRDYRTVTVLAGGI